jgi:hypothetical protein
VSDGIYAVSVRGPRSPTWNNELARRLSLHLGGWAACCVNDRLLDDYGYGYYLDGLIVEAAACSGRTIVERAGFLRDVPDRVLVDSLDEERNRRHFQAALAKLAGPYVSAWPPSGALRLLFVEGDAITVTELVRPPSTLVAVAGHDERIEIPGYAYEVEETRVLLARTTLPKWELLERIDAVDCVAIVTDGVETFVREPGEKASTQVPFVGLRDALFAWAPVCEATGTAPMAFTFDAVRPTSPWRG